MQAELLKRTFVFNGKRVKDKAMELKFQSICKKEIAATCGAGAQCDKNAAGKRGDSSSVQWKGGKDNPKQGLGWWQRSEEQSHQG